MEITITPETIQNLKNLQNKRKFVEEGFYPGASDEVIRKRCEEWINILLERIITNIKQNSHKEFVLCEFTNALTNFDEEDTEEREQACEYLEEIMTILGIESSDGVINKWLYGFDPS